MVLPGWDMAGEEPEHTGRMIMLGCRHMARDWKEPDLFGRMIMPGCSYWGMGGRHRWVRMWVIQGAGINGVGSLPVFELN